MGSSGDILNARVAVDFTGFDVQGSPDGMTIDSEGLLWVAMCHGGAVLCLNPEDGKLIRKIISPAWKQLLVPLGESIQT